MIDYELDEYQNDTMVSVVNQMAGFGIFVSYLTGLMFGHAILQGCQTPTRATIGVLNVLGIPARTAINYGGDLKYGCVLISNTVTI